ESFAEKIADLQYANSLMLIARCIAGDCGSIKSRARPSYRRGSRRRSYELGHLARRSWDRSRRKSRNRSSCQSEPDWPYHWQQSADEDIGSYNICRAALTVFDINIAIVIGPTPPGTGVIALAFGATSSNATSPTSR